MEREDGFGQLSAHLVQTDKLERSHRSDEQDRVAVAAAAIASVAGCYHQSRLDADKRVEQAEAALASANEQHARDQATLRETLSNRRDEISLFLDYMPTDSRDPQWNLKFSVLNSYCSEDAAAGGKVGRVLCLEIQKKGRELAASTDSAAARLAEQAAHSGDANRYVASDLNAKQGLALTAAESATPPVGSKWYAVIATVPLSQRLALTSLIADLDMKLQKAGLPPNDVHVFRTQISNSYAITSGLAKKETDAKQRARMLQRSGMVPDAFAQPDRNWQLADADTGH